MNIHYVPPSLTTTSYFTTYTPANISILGVKCPESPPNDDSPVSLVTGGAGFIGMHLCKELLKRGHRVYCLDIKDRIIIHNQLPSDDKFTYIQCNILEMMDLKYYKRHACGHYQNMVNIFDSHNIGKIDYIYHLACDASPPVYQKNKHNTMNVCTAGTLNVIKLAQSKPGSRVLLASTSEVYGEPINHPQSETDPLNIRLGPRACYDVGKMAAEVLLNDSNITEKRIARIFNTYGPGLRDGRVMSNFIEQALGGKDLTIYGDGSQTRSFCYVDDTVEALIKLMNSDYEGPVNIGNPTEISIKQLAQMIIEKTNSVEIKHFSLPIDDPTRRCPNIELANKILHWEPKVNLSEGIDKTIAWWKSLKNEINGSNTYTGNPGNHGC